MDDQIVAELNALRARAYGPGGGLGEDPDALRRLGDLEELARPRPTDPGEPVVAADGAETEEAGVPFADVETGAPAVAAEPSEAPAPSEAARPRLWWTRRRIVLLWVASLAVAVVMASTVSAAFTYRLQADPTEVAVLRADPGAQWPEFFGDEDGQVFAEFYGLRVFAQMNLPAATGRIACLQVAEKSILDSDLQQGFPGAYYPGGCATGAFAPTASLIVDDNAPDELRQRFPDGTSLQFVLRGSEVVVLAVPPQPEPQPSIDAAR